MKVTRAVVPSLFTVLNMFCGFLSIINSSKNEYVAACWFIILAAGFDALDGVMARLTKSSSDFGVEIDSLSDVVSFGAAPAFLMYQLSLHRLEGLGIFLSSLPMIFGGLRLARFNVQLVGHDKDHFVGLPVPASAMTISSFVLSYYSPISGLKPFAELVLPWMAVVLSLLMVSKIRYEALPKISRRAIRREPWKFIFVTLALIVAFVTGGDAVFPLFVLFITLGIARYLAVTIRHLLHADKLEEESAAPTRVDI